MNRPMKIRLLIVDDHPMVQVGLRTMLERFASIEVVGEAGTNAEAIAMVAETLPDVVLLDVRLGGESGFTTCREIQKLERTVRVIILTSFSDETTIFDAVTAGADAYLLKEIDGAALVRAIEDVAKGETVLDPAVRRIFGRVNTPTEAVGRENLDQLSAQERRVLTFVADGKTNKQIGEVMGLSDKTVKNYVSNILEKLGLSRRSEAAAFFVRHQYS